MNIQSFRRDLLLITLFLVCGFVFTSDAQTVTTVAGSTSGNLDGTGTAAQFSSPMGVVGNGNYLYVVDYASSRIRRIDLATNEVATIAGSTSGYIDGIGTAARFANPTGISYHNNNLYVAEFSGNRIRQINLATNEVTTVAGSTRGSVDGIGTAAQFNNPVAVTYADNYLYVAEQTSHRIRRVDLTTKEVTTIAGSTNGYTDAVGTAAQFSTPFALVCNGSDLYVGEAGGNRIRKIDLTTNQVSTIAGSIAGSNDGIGTDAQFRAIWGITYYDNSLYVSDQGNHRIRKIDLNNNEVTTVAGSSSGYLDSTGTTARFSGPSGITYFNNRLYIAEFAGNRIRSLTFENALPVVWGRIVGFIKNDQLEVQFTTYQEINNQEFAIEVSANGKDFKEVQRLSTLAVNGNSDTKLYYHIQISQAAASAALGTVFLLCLLSTVSRTVSRWRVVLLLVLIVNMYSCNKKGDITTGNSYPKIFVRIAQIDKDGSKTYSQAVRAIQQ